MQSTEKKSMVETLEEINCSKNVSDIWNDLHDELDSSKNLFYIPQGTFVRCRLLGNILPCKRTFIKSSFVNPVCYFAKVIMKLILNYRTK
jgi:hypothetical protein